VRPRRPLRPGVADKATMSRRWRLPRRNLENGQPRRPPPPRPSSGRRGALALAAMGPGPFKARRHLARPSTPAHLTRGVLASNDALIPAGSCRASDRTLARLARRRLRGDDRFGSHSAHGLSRGGRARGYGGGPLVHTMRDQRRSEDLRRPLGRIAARSRSAKPRPAWRPKPGPPTANRTSQREDRRERGRPKSQKPTQLICSPGERLKVEAGRQR